jgi:hypothetical protein
MTEMTDNDVTLSRKQVTEIFNAIRGIEHLLKGFQPTSGNAAESYAIMSNIAVIQSNLAGMPRVNSN